MVKYMAKSAAKNINSLESQTIVPTATILGRLIRGAGELARAAEDIRGLFPISRIIHAVKAQLQ
jgi:hypothetical protein